MFQYASVNTENKNNTCVAILEAIFVVIWKSILYSIGQLAVEPN